MSTVGFHRFSGQDDKATPDEVPSNETTQNSTGRTSRGFQDGLSPSELMYLENPQLRKVKIENVVNQLCQVKIKNLVLPVQRVTQSEPESVGDKPLNWPEKLPPIVPEKLPSPVINANTEPKLMPYRTHQSPNR
jgi:hypothetical protein